MVHHPPTAPLDTSDSSVATSNVDPGRIPAEHTTITVPFTLSSENPSGLGDTNYVKNVNTNVPSYCQRPHERFEQHLNELQRMNAKQFDGAWPDESASSQIRLPELLARRQESILQMAAQRSTEINQSDSGYNSKSSDAPQWTPSECTTHSYHEHHEHPPEIMTQDPIDPSSTELQHNMLTDSIPYMKQHPVGSNIEGSLGPAGSLTPTQVLASGGLVEPLDQPIPIPTTTGSNSHIDVHTFGSSNVVNSLRNTDQAMHHLQGQRSHGSSVGMSLALNPLQSMLFRNHHDQIDKKIDTKSARMRKRSRTESAITREKNRQQDANVRCCISLYGCQEKGRNDKVRQFTLGSPCNNCLVCTRYDDKKIEEKLVKLQSLEKRADMPHRKPRSDGSAASAVGGEGGQAQVTVKHRRRGSPHCPHKRPCREHQEHYQERLHKICLVRSSAKNDGEVRIVGAWYRRVDESLVPNHVQRQVLELRQRCADKCKAGAVAHPSKVHEFHLVTVIDKEKQVRMTWDPVPFLHESEATMAWNQLVGDTRTKYRNAKERVEECSGADAVSTMIRICCGGSHGQPEKNSGGIWDKKRDHGAADGAEAAGGLVSNFHLPGHQLVRRQAPPDGDVIIDFAGHAHLPKALAPHQCRYHTRHAHESMITPTLQTLERAPPPELSAYLLRDYQQNQRWPHPLSSARYGQGTKNLPQSSEHSRQPHQVRTRQERGHTFHMQRYQQQPTQQLPHQQQHRQQLQPQRQQQHGFELQEFHQESLRQQEQNEPVPLQPQRMQRHKQDISLQVQQQQQQQCGYQPHPSAVVPASLLSACHPSPAGHLRDINDSQPSLSTDKRGHLEGGGSQHRNSPHALSASMTGTVDDCGPSYRAEFTGAPAGAAARMCAISNDDTVFMNFTEDGNPVEVPDHIHGSADDLDHGYHSLAFPT
eukprot:m.1602968 g.1602968  ORF g.1602968 m.1602968 type:complete len:929 (-) comp25355_c1_seq13:4852-7638(-)